MRTQELASYVESRVLTSLHVAFSRETTGPKVYVQHLIEAEGVSTLWPLINDKKVRLVASLLFLGSLVPGLELTVHKGARVVCSVS